MTDDDEDMKRRQREALDRLSEIEVDLDPKTIDELRAEAHRREQACAENSPDLDRVLNRFASGRRAAVGTGRGWHRIIADLDQRIEQLDPEMRYSSIKTKLAGLRVYLDRSASDEIQATVQAAEQKAGRTCEECGHPGRFVKVVGYRTLCDVHGILSRAGSEPS